MSDGTGTTWTMTLASITQPDGEAYALAASTVAAVMRFALSSISVRSEEEVQHLFESALDRGLLNRIVFASVHDLAYSAVIDRATFLASPRRDCGPIGTFQARPRPCEPGLEFPTTPGPNYSEEEGRKRASTRYSEITTRLVATLPALRSDSNFVRIVADLREEGWLDWHILLAVFNVAINERYKLALRNMRRQDLPALEAMMKRPEDPGSPIPIEAFTESRLREALGVSMFSTLKQWGHTLDQNPPDGAALVAMLVWRFGYASDDAPHRDPFDLTAWPDE
jgi:hypothetical protein